MMILGLERLVVVLFGDNLLGYYVIQDVFSKVRNRHSMRQIIGIAGSFQ
jgi:hypothetical protein